MSRLNTTTVEQFFVREEKNARRMLRAQMESWMDTIFGEIRRKFMLLVSSQDLVTEIVKVQDDFGPLNREQQLHSSSNQIFSTTANSQVHFGDMIPLNLSKQGGLSDRQHVEQQLESSLNQIPSPSADSRAQNITFLNQLQEEEQNDDDDDEIVVKNELGEIVNIIEPNESIPSSSTQTKPANENIYELGDEENCDCDECLGKLFVFKNEEGDEEELQLNDELDENDDDDDASSSRPTKRPRLEHDHTQYQTQVLPDDGCFVCQYPRCHKMYRQASKLKIHQRTHRQPTTKLYRCKWPKCQFRGSAKKANTLAHIGIHLTQAASCLKLRKQKVSKNPYDYLEEGSRIVSLK